MRKRLAVALAVIGGVVAMGASLLAHHAAATYDRNKEVTMEGTLKEFRMINPHPQLLFTVKGPGGIEEWFGESQSPPYRWYNNGWTVTTVKPGDTITIIGHPSIEEGRKRINIERIVAPNGTEYPPKGGRIGPLD